MIGRVRPSVDLAHPQVSSIALYVGVDTVGGCGAATRGHATRNSYRG